MEIEFNYLYRDYANYKNHNCVIFSNKENIPVEDIATAIQNKLIDGVWFYANKWNVPDLHFEKWDEEIDHNYHEFGSVQNTTDAPTDARDIKEFLQHL